MLGELKIVSIFPFVYTGDGPSQEVSNRRLFQPTLMEFKHYTRMRKGKSNLRKCRADVVVCKTSCADTANVNGHDCVETKITDVHSDVPTTVDLRTPSPTLSFDSFKDNPMNELFDCIERNEKFECQTVDGLGQECQKIDSPVVLQGFELYEYMLVEPCQNLEITSDEVSNDVTSHVTPPSPKMFMPPNIQTSELPVVDISSPQPLPESNGTHVLKSSTNQSVCPPSFELLDQSYMDVCDNTQLSVVSNIPVKVVTNSGKKPSTPYTYSKSNLILVVEEGQSMYSQLCNDVRYSKISGMRPNGNAYTQLRLNEDYMSPAKTIELLNDMRTPLLNGGTSQANSIFISSPDFWASVVASADALESTVNPPRIGDISDVARRINFSQSDIISKESPYVSSMIKRVKDRNAEKVANKRKKDRELHLIDTNNGALVPKLNEETKRLVMKAEYRSSSFYLIANDTVTCLGQHLNDILQHKTYDVMLVEVFFGVIRAELAEKCVHGSRFQFVNPELFDDEYEDRTSRVVPQLVNSRDVEIHHNVVCASMNGDFKRHGRFYIIAMKTMTHWHFLLWSRAENRYTHYDSNREIRGAVNTGAVKRTRHSDPQFVDCLTFPQEINPKLDGGLYMFHGISSLIDYLHIEDGLFNDISLDEQMSWKKSDVPKLRNCLFRRLVERMEYSDWTVKMKNSNIRKRRFK
ncbi:hypothetical protein ZOSMA_84G00550 [Zostera marina]|uniref:Uncharacterized protein n=1 Tax=Zostera marina TaxID=29655 RepID=A0A0K9NNI5_ZOSMR|nr:hypothetical protein ZOSMA_84G00550 [Zostera marina]